MSVYMFWYHANIHLVCWQLHEKMSLATFCNHITVTLNETDTQSYSSMMNFMISDCKVLRQVVNMQHSKKKKKKEKSVKYLRVRSTPLQILTLSHTVLGWISYLLCKVLWQVINMPHSKKKEKSAKCLCVWSTLLQTLTLSHTAQWWISWYLICKFYDQ